jgi:ribosomal protein S18 acetylase RimI-like enzyme
MMAATRKKRARGQIESATRMVADSPAFLIRPVKADDVRHVTAIDERITGIRKTAYWADVFERYSKHRSPERFFLVAASAGMAGQQQILGFIIGEIRTWEFGSAPCGWVFALSVDPTARLHGVGEALFDSLSTAFKKAGVNKMRTMVSHDNRLHLRFFRGEGMTAGPYIQLEKDLV